MWDRLLALYGDLPESQRGAVLVAAVAVAGVFGTALFTLLTGTINALSTIFTRVLTSRHEHAQWRRSKIWDSYVGTIENLRKHHYFIEIVREDYFLQAFVYIDWALHLKYPGVYALLLNESAYAEQPTTPEDCIWEARTLVDSTRKYIEDFNKNTPILADGAQADRHYEDVRAHAKALADYSRNFNFDFVDKLTAIIHKTKVQFSSADMESLNKLRAEIEDLMQYLKKGEHEEKGKLDAVRIEVAKRMRRL